MRKAERKAVDQPVRLHPSSWCTVEARLIDCSEDGFRAQAEVRVRNRDEITLEVPGIGPAKAFVVWVRHDQFGAQFLQPIAIDQAELQPAGEEERLARLLVQRAAAQRSGLWQHEEALRQQIAQALPTQRG
jgi:hypothetical protein